MEQRGPVLVTGGSRGIGAAIALRLARDGFDIWLNYRGNHHGARSVREEIEATGRGCLLLPFDVGDEAQVEEALAPLLQAQTPFALVHNAGITADAVAAMMSTDQWRRVLSVHLDAFFFLSRAFLRHMLVARRGRIVALTSISGQAGQTGQINYGAAKAGITGAVKSLAREVGRRGILVNAVAPGLIETSMTEGMDHGSHPVPLGRMGKASEVAGVVSFLLGPDSTYITGQEIGVNGGLYM